jgi:hypothetical protein
LIRTMRRTDSLQAASWVASEHEVVVLPDTSRRIGGRKEVSVVLLEKRQGDGANEKVD